jgi:hypothetical protein
MEAFNHLRPSVGDFLSLDAIMPSEDLSAASELRYHHQLLLTNLQTRECFL